MFMVRARITQLLLHLAQGFYADLRRALSELELKKIIGMSVAVGQVVFHVQCKTCSLSRQEIYTIA